MTVKAECSNLQSVWDAKVGNTSPSETGALSQYRTGYYYDVAPLPNGGLATMSYLGEGGDFLQAISGSAGYPVLWNGNDPLPIGAISDYGVAVATDNPAGYNLSQIVSDASYSDARCAYQTYDVAVHTVGSAPGDFVALSSVNVGYFAGAAGWTQVEIGNGSAVIAAGVDQIQFTFHDSSGTGSNFGEDVYREIDVFVRLPGCHCKSARIVSRPWPPMTVEVQQPPLRCPSRSTMGLFAQSPARPTIRCSPDPSPLWPTQVKRCAPSAACRIMFRRQPDSDRHGDNRAVQLHLVQPDLRCAHARDRSDRQLRGRLADVGDRQFRDRRRADKPGRHAHLGHADQPQLDGSGRLGQRLQRLSRHNARRREEATVAKRRTATAARQTVGA